MPIQRATAIFPRIPPMNSAAITNGTTARPTTDTASSTHTGPVSSITRRPTANAVSGRSSNVRTQARIGSGNTDSGEIHEERQTDDAPHPRQVGNDGRPQNSPRVIHGTSSSRRPPKMLAPITMCWPPGENPGRRVEAPPPTNEVRADLGAARPSWRCRRRPPACRRSSAVLPNCALPSTTTTSLVDVPFDRRVAEDDDRLADFGRRP